MASLAGKGKSVIGMFVDGLDVKLARLSLRRKQVVVEELKTATLVSRLHESKIADVTAGGLDTGDAFNLGSQGERKRSPTGCPRTTMPY